MNIFLSKPLVIKSKIFLVSPTTSLLGYDNLTGARKWAKPLAPKLKPVIQNKNVFLFSKKNIHICMKVNMQPIIGSTNNNTKIIAKNV